jgi:hypothetical protein
MPGSADLKAYRMSRAARAFRILIGVAGFALGVSMLWQFIQGLADASLSLWDSLILLLVMVLAWLGAVAVIVQAFIVLAVSKAGLEYRQFGIRFFTAWDNVAWIESRLSYRSGSYASVHLKRPAERLSDWDWLGRKSLKSFDISWLARQLKEGELGGELRRNAPHLKH